jgi:hypothetical protein
VAVDKEKKKQTKKSEDQDPKKTAGGKAENAVG